TLRKTIALGLFRVLIYFRLTTGASDIRTEGTEAEEEIWTDDLHELLSRNGVLPVIVGGSSPGERTSLLFALHHPQAVRGLLLFRVTGGAFAAGRLPENYYGQFIRAAEQGGMAGGCATEQYQGRLAANPGNRARLMAMKPERYIEVMSNWRKQFSAGGQLP